MFIGRDCLLSEKILFRNVSCRQTIRSYELVYFMYFMANHAVLNSIIPISASSPIFTHLSSTVTGLTTIRAHKSQDVFQRLFDEAQNVNSSAYFLFIASSHWFGFYVDWICVIFVSSTTFGCIYLRDCKLLYLVTIGYFIYFSCHTYALFHH